MVRPLNDSPYLYGLHDPGGEHLMAQAGTPGWILFTEQIGDDPADQSSKDYSSWANAGYGIMVRLNHGYEPDGTIPHEARYGEFSRRVTNFVAASRGCHIWIIGNEMNYAVERPNVSFNWTTNPPSLVTTGEVILPQMYAVCYSLCRKAIKALPGHASDQVITGAVAPWNVQTTYDGNPSGDWVQYQTDMLTRLGPSGCDGIAIHTYTHGADPNLVHTSTAMDPPFSNRQYNFRAYQDFMKAIPANMHHLPVYITETDQNDAWQNVNNGWIQRAYGEIEWWNRLPDTQVIRALILYRWPNYDRWGLETKTALHEDLRQAMTHRYNWEAAMATKSSTEPTPDTGVAQPAVTDVTNQLSRDAAGFIKRTRADIKYVVINHTAVRPEVGADRVASAQRQRWPGIVSQFFITGDGKIQRTNPDLEVVSRDQLWIFNGLNVYVAGNFDSAVPSDAQLDALAHLCAWLLDQYGLKIDAVKGVSEFIETHSPGLQWLQGARWKEKLVSGITPLMGDSKPPEDGTLAELRAEVERLKTQVQTLQNQNTTLTSQVDSLTTANTALKAQVAAAATEKQALEKRIAELEARIAELTKGNQPPGPAPAPAIQDIVNNLPKHPTERYDTRSLSAITTLAIHHSAAGGDIPPQNVAAYHVRKGWPGMGYHFYVMGDGTIYQCNNLETISYHAGYPNPYSVGICLAGSFMGIQPPDKQLAAAASLVAYLSQKLKIQTQNIKGHKELPQTATACPGSDWIEGLKWKNKLLSQVKAITG